MDEYKEIELSKIVWKDPLREEISREDIDAMSTSLMVHGQIHNIVVDAPDEKGIYEGVCGRLRFLGAQKRELLTIQARVHKFESEEEKLEWKLAENLHRRDIPVISKAEGYTKLEQLVRKRLEKEIGKQPSEKAVRVAIVEEQERLTGEEKAEETVRQYLKIASDLPKEVKKSIARYALGMAHCQELLRIEDPQLQVWLAEEAGRGKWTREKLRQIVNNLQRASDVVKTVLICRGIGSGHLKHLVRLRPHQQEKALDSVKREGMTPKETKLLVDLILEKPEEIDRLVSLTPFELEAEKEKARVVTTPEELEEAWKKEEMEKFQPIHTHSCPGCGREITIKIDWLNGVVEWIS